jgi:integrase
MKSGYVYQDPRNKKWVARLTYTGNDGKQKSLKQSADSKTEAKRILKALVLKMETKGEESIRLEKIIFRDLAERYASLKIKAPVFRGDKLISGLRSHKMLRIYLGYLVSHFGAMRVVDISPARIQAYKEDRLNTLTNRGTGYSLSAVNRELQLLRAILNFGKQEGILERTPFERSTQPIIEVGDETKRNRVLSQDEEIRLLKACDTPTRAQIKPLVIAAIDTGMRRGELLSLLWSDVDIEAKTITLRALETKTLKSRVLPISERLYCELQKLREQFPTRLNVFGIRAFHHSFNNALRDAEIADFHFHDCRHTFCSRLVESGMEISELAKLSGHASLDILFKVYVNHGSKTIDKARALLNQINKT